MSGGAMRLLSFEQFTSQPVDVRGQSKTERDALIINATLVDGRWVIISKYGDDVWHLGGFTSNVPRANRLIDFSKIPKSFISVMKAVVYRYLRRGRSVGRPPKGGTLKSFFGNARPFLCYLETLNIRSFSAVNAMICANYVVVCREHRQVGRFDGELLSKSHLVKRFSAVEAIYELSQFTEDPMLEEPWPETSSIYIAGLDNQPMQGGKTPLIPDAEFCALFKEAYDLAQIGNALLDVRDSLDSIGIQRQGKSRQVITNAKTRYLNSLGLEGGMSAFNKTLSDLRTACYIVLATLSGCRNHELTSLQLGAHWSTEDDEGTVYHWMRSRSEKTNTGVHDWMIPDAAVHALRIMERWAVPFQALVNAEIDSRSRINPSDPEIAELTKHRSALFLGRSKGKGSTVRTLSILSWRSNLKAFANNCGLNWDLSTHQFRRKFANYAAHSRFGDLRYLKEHFAHHSMDMTLGYAMDETWGQHFDLDLYVDIQNELEDIKIGIVDSWMSDSTLAGGYGESIKRWQRDPQNLLIFKDRASMLKSIAESTNIRSNGHAWCTADSDGCVGNTLERTRCGDGCRNAVIGQRHAGFYKHLYNQLKELLDCAGIGESGRQRVLRDLSRCRNVLLQLGVEPEALIA